MLVFKMKMLRITVGLFLLLIATTQASDDIETKPELADKEEMLNGDKEVGDAYYPNMHRIRIRSDDIFDINERSGFTRRRFRDGTVEGGDMLMTHQQKRIEEQARNNPGTIQQDMIASEVRHWPKVNGRVKVPITISNTVRRDGRKMAAINQAIKNYKTKSCIDFETVVNRNQHHIRILSSDGCYSYIGKVKLRGNNWQPLSIGNGCGRVGIVEHEMLHALGFYHEQSRFDRDEYVKVMLQNVRNPAMARNFRKNKYEDLITKDLPYDFDSVMHYGSTAFAKRGTRTMEKLDGSEIIPQRKGLSSLDRKLLNMVYGCGEVGPPAPPTAGPPTGNNCQKCAHLTGKSNTMYRHICEKIFCHGSTLAHPRIYASPRI